MTHQKIISLIQELHLVFDIVRLVDITNNTQYTLNDATSWSPLPTNVIRSGTGIRCATTAFPPAPAVTRHA